MEFDPRFPSTPWDSLVLPDDLENYSGGRELLWWGVVQLGEPGPSLPAVVEGVDWTIRLPNKPFEAPGFDVDGKPEDVVIPTPLAIFSVATGERTVSKARDIGRAKLRSLLGFVHLRSPLVVAANLVWEGPCFFGDSGTLGLASGSQKSVIRISEEGLDEARRVLTGINLASVAPRQALALQWFAEAWERSTTSSRFANLWFAVVALVDPTFSAKERRDLEQMERIRRFLLPVPISTAARTNLNERLQRAYGLRNRLVHAGDQTGITPDALVEPGYAVVELLQIDLRQI